MYRTIIIDDEIWSVIGLKKIIEGFGGNYQVIYETTDSLDGLAQIEALKPDLVFTDIRMPDMSGLELMKNVRKKGLDTEFVVISGFSEFSYAQEALREGALDYQLKPFNRQEIYTMLEKAAQRLEEKKKSSDWEFYLQLQDKENDVRQLLSEKFGKPLYEKLQVILVCHEIPRLKELAFSFEGGGEYLMIGLGPKKSLYILHSKRNEENGIREQLKEQAEFYRKAAVGSVKNTRDPLDTKIWKEVETAILDDFVAPKDKVFMPGGKHTELLRQKKEDIAQLKQAAKNRRIREILEGIPALFAENDMGIEDAVYFWNSVSPVIQTGEEIPEVLDLYELTEQFGNLEEMCDYLSQCLVQGEEEEAGSVNEKFNEMLAFIETHYGDSLVLKELCNQFFINMSYCCELFQKNKNMTFSQYVTQLRLEKACSLLKSSRISVAELCDMTGYKDYFYFNKVFKKKMGCTPAEYRKKYGA